MKLAVLAFAAIAAVGLAAGPARAFTYDAHGLQNSDGSTKFSDPEENLTGGSLGNTGSSKNGFSFHFSGGGNSSAGSDSRFAPSANGAFNSPFAGPNAFDYALGNRH